MPVPGVAPWYASLELYRFHRGVFIVRLIAVNNHLASHGPHGVIADGPGPVETDAPSVKRIDLIRGVG